MSTTPVIAYLLLDDQYDPVFDTGVELTNAQAVRQAILTRLKLFLGEWWENLNLGLPVFQTMLGQLDTARTQAATQLAIQQTIYGTPYVTAVTAVSVSFEDGKFTFSATAQTSFGTVSVTNLPALSASLD